MNETTPCDLAVLATRPLPRICADLPLCGGRYKSRPEDFEVEEVPAYLPVGEGEHLFLWIEKVGMSTPQLCHELGRALNVSPHDIGTAGLKDAFAVTRQFVSVPRRVKDLLPAVSLPNAKVLTATLHGNKLKTGHLRGNRFRMRLRDPASPEAAEALVSRLKEKGLPNFYGPQRFGHGGETVRLGLKELGKSQEAMRRPLSRTLRRLALSAVQSALFNEYVRVRLREGQLHTAVAGDVFQVRRSGGPFTSDDLVREQGRIDAREIVPTGPMFGPKMRAALADAAALESKVLGACGLAAKDFAGHGHILEGTRRPVLVWPEEMRAEVDGEGVVITCVLPSGSYATVLLGELGACPAKGDEGGQSDHAD